MINHWSIMRVKCHTDEDAQPHGIIITEVVRGRHDASHRYQLDCLVNGLFRQKRMHQGSYDWYFFKESASYWWVPIIKGQEYEEYPHIFEVSRRRLHTNGKIIMRVCAHDMTLKTHVPYAYNNDKWYHFQLMWCKGNIHGKESQSLRYHFLGFKRREAISIHGPLTRYAKLRVAHASGMPGNVYQRLNSVRAPKPCPNKQVYRCIFIYKKFNDNWQGYNGSALCYRILLSKRYCIRSAQKYRGLK